MGEIEDEWRKLLLTQIEELNTRIDKTLMLIEKHEEKDGVLYQDVADLKIQATLFGRIMKVGATAVSALGIDRIYHFFK